MTAAAFEYVRVGAWDEAVEQLQLGGGDARVIAGGQSLAPMMMTRVAQPELLVDVAGVGTKTIEHRDGVLRLSALVRHADILRSTTVRAACPVLVEAAAHIGNVRVRHRGTIGGTFAQGDATAEYSCVGLALGATVCTLGPDGARSIAVDDLLVTHQVTALQPGEVITEVELPVHGTRQGAAFVEVAGRPGDLARVAVAASVTLTPDGLCQDVRLVVGAIAGRPQQPAGVAAVLEGRRPDDATLAAAGRTAAEEVSVTFDRHVSEAYCRRLVAVLGRRTLAAAVARAQVAEDVA